MVAMNDQEHAALRDTAVLAGEYYSMLRRAGTPLLLAVLLVRDWHGWLWAPTDHFHDLS